MMVAANNNNIKFEVIDRAGCVTKHMEDIVKAQAEATISKRIVCSLSPN